MSEVQLVSSSHLLHYHWRRRQVEMAGINYDQAVAVQDHTYVLHGVLPLVQTVALDSKFAFLSVDLGESLTDWPSVSNHSIERRSRRACRTVFG